MVTAPRSNIIERCLARGQLTQARRHIDEMALRAGNSAEQHHAAAQFYMHAKAPTLALEHYDQAIALAPDNPAFLYNQSTALMALGRLQDAETALDRVIQLAPDDWDAWYNRSTLRRQTHDSNHVAAIHRALASPAADAAASIPLNYALARELEDLGKYDSAFEALERGASARRAMLSYDVTDDVWMMQSLAAAFGENRDESRIGCEDDRPLFVLGLPRSGTTLVDRILSAHSAVASHGESNDFALALTQLASPYRSKQELLERAFKVDPNALGQAYCRRVTHAGTKRVVDKTPANFLYLGLIARALPNARIIHVRRHPADVCYAMYKTLFRMAYPYSYDLDDLATYWQAFDILMSRWQDLVSPSRLLVVDYERLVRHPEEVARAMISHAGLPWEDGCLDFHKNDSPSLTASAAQVRQPIYSSSVGLWRRYRRQLQPLTRRLEHAGVNLESETHSS